jgi:hypothetical protein
MWERDKGKDSHDMEGWEQREGWELGLHKRNTRQGDDDLEMYS